MEPNYEKEVSLLTQKLQEETLLRVRYQAMLDDKLEEIEQLKSVPQVNNEEKPEYHIVESGQ